MSALVANWVVTVEAKLASSFKAAASSLSVLSVAGAESMSAPILLLIASFTKLVAAAVLSLLVASTADSVTVPVKVGLSVDANEK